MTDTDDLRAKLGIDTDNLGCVMIRTRPILYPDKIIPDSFWYKDPEKPDSYGKEDQPHVTLLYGLLTPAYEQEENVSAVLGDWYAPTYARVTQFITFESEKYDAVVGTLYSPREFVDANQRLSKLPHIDTFLPYTPHVTIGYVLKGIGRHVTRELNEWLTRSHSGMLDVATLEGDDALWLGDPK